MKLELLDGKSADEIGEIWRAFFINKDSLSAVIPADTYRQMEEKLRQHCTVSKSERLWENLNVTVAIFYFGSSVCAVSIRPRGPGFDSSCHQFILIRLVSLQNHSVHEQLTLAILLTAFEV